MTDTRQPDDSSTPATTIAALVRDAARQHALSHFLQRLKQFARAVGHTPDQEMPEHDIVWMTGFPNTLGSEVNAALRELPALWRPAMPDDQCIVPRRLLLQIVDENTVSWMEAVATAEITNRAASLQRERIEAEYRQRRGETAVRLFPPISRNPPRV